VGVLRRAGGIVASYRLHAEAELAIVDMRVLSPSTSAYAPRARFHFEIAFMTSFPFV
jgi:hypothetical protein